MAAAVTLTNQLFYDHLLVVHFMPLNGDFFDCSTVSQNILNSIFDCEESTSFLWRSNKKVGVVLHGGSQLVIRNIGEWAGVVRRNNRFGSERVRPFFVEGNKLLNHIVRKEPNFNSCFDEGS